MDIASLFETVDMSIMSIGSDTTPPTSNQNKKTSSSSSLAKKQNNYVFPTRSSLANDVSNHNRTSSSSHLIKKVLDKPFYDVPNKNRVQIGSFSGIIDMITGFPVHGRLNYFASPESFVVSSYYEGPFLNNKRHGSNGLWINPDLLFNDENADNINNRLDDDDNLSLSSGGSLFGGGQNNSEIAVDSKFLGTFRNDLPVKGILVTPNYTYEGSFVSTDNKATKFHGKGRLCKTNGDLYEGEFLNGLYHFVGKLTSGENGETRYNGEWRHGLKNGIGTLESTTYAMVGGDDAKKSKKKSKSNKKSSKDLVDEKKQVVISHYLYSGVFRNGCKEGEGTEKITYVKEKKNKEEKYEGQWWNNKRHGYGTLTRTDGLILEGKWRAGITLCPVYDCDDELSDNTDEEENSRKKKKTQNHTHNKVTWTITYPSGSSKTSSKEKGSLENTSAPIPSKYEGEIVKEFPIPSKKKKSSSKNSKNKDPPSDSDAVFLPHGYGTMIYNQGKEVYTGSLKLGKRSGEGLHVNLEGNELSGRWKDDMYIGPSIVTKEEVMSKSPSRAKKIALNRIIDGITIDEDEESTTTEEGSIDTINDEKLLPVTNLNDTVDEDNISLVDLRSHCSLDILEEDDDDYSLSGASDGGSGSRYSFFSSSSRSILSSLSNSYDDSEAIEKDDYKQKQQYHITYPNGDVYIGHILPICEGQTQKTQKNDNVVDLSPLDSKEDQGKIITVVISNETQQQSYIRHGYGKYTEQRTGSSYEGDWLHDKRSGNYGVLLTENAKYMGNWNDDFMEGQGTYIGEDSSTYVGSFYRNEFCGSGRYVNSEGRIYVGNFLNGQKHGDGQEISPDKQVYLGNWKNNKRNGVGTLLEKQGGRVLYSGEWKDDEFHGRGAYVWSVSSKKDKYQQYVGEFKSNLRDGHGILTTYKGAIYEGDWQRDLPLSGRKWKIQYKDGSHYYGKASPPLKESQPQQQEKDKLVLPVPHGYGTMKYSNKDVFSGYFLEGKRNGKGICTFGNGDTWNGDWKSDSIDMDGDGELTLSDGTIHKFYSQNSNDHLT